MLVKKYNCENLAQLNPRLKWSKGHVQNVKYDELLWLVEHSLKNGTIMKVYTGDGSVV